MSQKMLQGKTRTMTVIAMMTAVICILGPLSVPIGPVPISFIQLAIFLSLYILGWKMGTLSCVLYILIGLVGLPVFSGFSGGIAKLTGPTGGYIIGYIPMALIAGYVIEKKSNRFLHMAAMVAGTAVCYILGTAWFCIVTNNTVGTALSVCVLPFIPADLIKIVVVSAIGVVIRKALQRAGLIQ